MNKIGVLSATASDYITYFVTPHYYPLLYDYITYCVTAGKQDRRTFYHRLSKVAHLITLNKVAKERAGFPLHFIEHGIPTHFRALPSRLLRQNHVASFGFWDEEKRHHELCDLAQDSGVAFDLYSTHYYYTFTTHYYYTVTTHLQLAYGTQVWRLIYTRSPRARWGWQGVRDLSPSTESFLTRRSS